MNSGAAKTSIGLFVMFVAIIAFLFLAFNWSHAPNTPDQSQTETPQMTEYNEKGADTTNMQIKLWWIALMLVIGLMVFLILRYVFKIFPGWTS